MQGHVLSVSDLNEYVRRSLAGDPMLQDTQLRGEISNFKPYASGHWYFSLKDEQSRINCVMFRQHNVRLQIQPRDGMQVVLRGSAGLYVSSGNYQFYAEGMRADGLGDLFVRFNALKDQLLKEGLFDPLKKKPLPLLPRAVGIVTSASGAVLHDILTVTRRRFPNMRLVLRPSQVQGEGAKEDLAQALQEIAQVDGVDVVIIGRGGGSMEDLWAFNEELVVRAVAACPVPVISAVGHETDTTLCDFAADMRAPTPSAAAELAVPDKRELESRLKGMQSALLQAAQLGVLRLMEQARALEQALKAMDPAMQLQTIAHRCRLAEAALEGLVERQLKQSQQLALGLMERLRALGPGQTLARGYALARDGDRPVTSVHALPERFSLVLRDGKAWVQTLSVEVEDFS